VIISSVYYTCIDREDIHNYQYQRRTPVLCPESFSRFCLGKSLSNAGIRNKEIC